MSEDNLYRFKDSEEYKKRLASEPSSDWVNERSLGGSKKWYYIPIEVKEALADLVYRVWNVVDERYTVINNEIIFTVKIEALPDYPNADFEHFTGSASKPIPCDKGADPTQFPKGKKVNALQYALKAVRSDAIGSAFEHKGNLFGRNVSRPDVGNDFCFDVSYERD